MEDNLKKELDVLKNDINSMIDEGKASGKAVEDQLKNAVAEWSDKHAEMKKMTDEQLQKHQEQVNELATAVKEYKAANKKSRIVSPYEYLKGELEKNEYFARYKEHRQSFDMQVKSGLLYKDIVGADDFTGDVIQPDRVSDMTYALPHEQRRARDIFGAGFTQSDTVSFVRSTSTRSAATNAEGGSKAQSEEAFTEVTEPVRVIAHYFRVSNEALADYAQMATYLSVEGVAGLKDEEDDQILNGSGVSPNLNGVVTQASTTFAGGTSITSDTDIDTLVRGYWQLRALNYNPDFILIPPSKMRDIQLIKETGGAYIYPNFAPVGLNDWAINGARLYDHTAMADDTFLIGDSSKAMVWDRQAVNIKMSESDATNFTTNKTTIRIEERLACAVYRTDAFISTTFTLAQSTLT